MSLQPTEGPVIAAFRRRAAALTALVVGVRWLAAACFAWGVALAALRTALQLPGSTAAWGLLSLGPLAVVALAQGWRARPSRAAVRALLDRENHAGGLVMAAGETELERWRPRVASPQVPGLRARPAWGPLAAGMAFVAGVAWMPVSPPGLEGNRTLEIGDEVARLAQRVEALEDEGLLSEDEATTFEEALEELLSEASGEDPAKAWETLDHLQERADQAVDELAETALAESEQLASASQLAEALADAASSADPAELAQAVAELSALTSAAASDSRLLDAAAAGELKTSAGAGLDEMLSALDRGKANLGDRLDRMASGGALDVGGLMQAREALERGSQSLGEFLDANGLQASGSMLGKRAGVPGRGGVTRGRGDAPMRWRPEPLAEDGQFREQFLEAGASARLADHRLLGLSLADPSRPGVEAAVGSAPGVDVEAVAGGGSAVTHPLLPRHRGAVRRFFDRPEPPPPEQP
ncbi:MAG: hypothetical protein AAF560_02985 [Acidobacteriota bacterium]